MKDIIVALLLIASFSSVAYPQQQAPQILINAARCLAAKKFLEISKQKEVSLGYFVDEQSYPGTKEMYVIAYAAHDQSSGSAFAIVLTEVDGYQVFNIQNNAKFVLAKRGIHGVFFATPPLGGDWTQERLASAVAQIQKQPRFTVPIKSLIIRKFKGCESYADPQFESGAEIVGPTETDARNSRRALLHGPVASLRSMAPPSGDE